MFVRKYPLEKGEERRGTFSHRTLYKLVEHWACSNCAHRRSTFRSCAFCEHRSKPNAQTPWHFLYFFPLPHGQGSFRPTLSVVRRTGVCGFASSSPRLKLRRGGAAGRRATGGGSSPLTA